jgi:hypothetical protein
VWSFDNETDARAMVDRLMRAEGAGTWQELPIPSLPHRRPEQE